jgi:hypothetical protein
VKVFLCRECGLPFARVEEGCLVVEAYHRGSKHVCSVSILEVVFQELADQAERIERQREQITELRRELERRRDGGLRQTTI